MKKHFIYIIIGLVVSISVQAGDGLVSIRSSHDVQGTADKLVAALQGKGLTIFARIDHSAGAEKAGKSLPPTQLVIFGNPKVGTPLMNCSRTAGIDLPQKALIWEDPAGQTWLTYNDPAYLSERHGLDSCAKVIAKVTGILAKFAKVATQ